MKTGTVILLGAAALCVALAPRPAAAGHGAIACLDTSAYRKLAAEARLAPGAPTTPTLFGPLPDPQVGDTWDWFLWNLSGMPVANPGPCTVRASGPHVYIVVEDAQWNLGRVTQAQVDNVLRYFENESLGLFPTEGIWSLDTTAFGFPAIGLDNDPKVYILYYDFGTPNADGYVGWADAYPDNPADPFGRSNECEVLYMNTRPGAGVDHTPDHSYMLSVVAHEFEHLIHRAYDENEESWLDESLAEIGMYLFQPGTEFTTTFQGNPDISLTDGGNYGCWYFWGVHLWEEYGRDAISSAIVQNGTQQGIASVNAALSSTGHTETFPDVFRTWQGANWLDDPSIAGGVYGYDDWDYGSFTASASYFLYPTGNRSAGVSRWATDYVQFADFAPDGLRIFFDGIDNNNYAVQLILEDTTWTLPPQVNPIPLDAVRVGRATIPASSGYDLATLSIGAIEPTAANANYTYSASRVTPIDLRVAKNPANPEQDVDLSWFTTNSSPFRVLRAADPALVATNPDVEYPNVFGNTFTDANVTGPLTCYLVEVQ